jgi:hypothetical protein
MSYNFRPVNVLPHVIIFGLPDIVMSFFRSVNMKFNLMQKIILAYYFPVALIIIIRILNYLRKHPEGFSFENNNGI